MTKSTVQERQITINRWHSFAVHLFSIGITKIMVDFNDVSSDMRDPDNYHELNLTHKGEKISIEDWVESICENILENGIYLQYNCKVGSAEFLFSENGLAVNLNLPDNDDKISIQDYLFYPGPVIR